jgi:gamma-glutamylcyclotransferase (GGCT)/AIG2-like uncharacterized protein YtfP
LALLFVYGTLRPEAGDALGRRARDHLTRVGAAIGPATAPGCLYDLRRYPGLSEAGGGARLVKGDVIELAVPAATLAWLDRYEGNEYRRVRRRIILDTGENLEAWIYILRRKPSAAIIKGGDWLAHVAPRTPAPTLLASFRHRQSRRSRT